MCELRMVTKDTDLSNIKNKGTTYICDELYDVYNIKDCPHTEIDKTCYNSLWACKHGEIPSYETLIKFNGILSSCEINISNKNYIKEIISEIRNYVYITVKINNKQIYECCVTDDINYAFTKIQTIYLTLITHPIDFLKDGFENRILNRKVL